MVSWDPSDPLKLAEGESAKANSALADYALLGPGRSITALHRKYTDPSPGVPRGASISLRVLKGWSAAYGWQERVAQYDGLVQERQRAETEKRWSERREAEREETWKIAQLLRDKALKMLEFPLMEVEHVTDQRRGPNGLTTIEKTIVKPAKWSVRDVALLAEAAAKLARLSADLPTERLALEELNPRDLEPMSTDELLLLKQQIERAGRGRRG